MDPVGAANLGSAPSSSSGLEAGCRLLHSTAKQGRLTRTRAHAHAHAHAHSREHTHTHARARSASDRSRATPAPVARASPKENHANGAFRLVSANSRVLMTAHRSGRVRCSRAGQGAQLPHRRVAPKTSSASGPARRPRTSARSVSCRVVPACVRGCERVRAWEPGCEAPARQVPLSACAGSCPANAPWQTRCKRPQGAWPFARLLANPGRPLWIFCGSPDDHPGRTDFKPCKGEVHAK